MNNTTATKEELSAFARSNHRFLDALENGHQGLTDEVLERLLSSFDERLVQQLSFYGVPNAGSLNSIKSGRVTLQGKTFPMSQPEQEFVIQASKALNLDELKCYGVMREYLREIARRPVYEKGSALIFNNENLNEFTELYYEERISLLKVTSLIIRNSFNRDDPRGRVFDNCLDHLVKGGLEDNVLRDLKEAFTQKIPDYIGDDVLQKERWVYHRVFEQSLLLEILFLIEYSRSVCECENLFKILKIFRDFGFGTTQVNADYVNDATLEVISKVSFLCVIIIIQCFHLEQLDARPFEKLRSEFPIFLDGGRWLINFENEFSTENWGNIAEHGPILLTWSCILAYKASNEKSTFDFLKHANRALNIGALSYLSGTLYSGLLDNDVNYKHCYAEILRDFVNSFMTYFEVSNPQVHELLMDIVLWIYKQPELSTLFWRLNFSKKASYFLNFALSQFPYKPIPLLRILSALSSTNDCAQTTFNFLNHLEKFTSMVRVNMLEMETFTDQKNVRRIRLSRDTKFDGILMKAGTIGSYQEENGDLWKISWDFKYSGFELLVTKLYNITQRIFSKDLISVSEVVLATHIIYLISRIINHAPQTVDQMSEKELFFSTNSTFTLDTLLLNVLVLLLKSACFFEANDELNEDWKFVDPFNQGNGGLSLDNQYRTDEHYNKVIDTLYYSKRKNTDFVETQNISHPPLALLISCVDCLQAISVTRPTKVWAVLENSTDLFNQTSSWLGFQACIQHILRTIERNYARYPVTLSYLSFVQTLFSNSLKWHPVPKTLPQKKVAPTQVKKATNTSHISTEDVLPLLPFIHEIFANHETFAYQFISEKWKIALKILEIFLLIVVERTTSEQNSKGERVLWSEVSYVLLYDNAVIRNLIGLVSVGFRFLQTRSPQEKQLVESVVENGLKLIEAVIILRKNEKEGTATPLEHAIVNSVSNKNFENRVQQTSKNRTVRSSLTLPTTLIQTLAEYIFYFSNSKIPYHAIRILELISDTIFSPMTKPPSLVSFFGEFNLPDKKNPNLIPTNNQAIILRSSFLNRLKDKNEDVELRVVILSLIGKSMENQMGLIDLFFKPPVLESSSSASENNDVVNIVLSILSDKNTPSKLFCQLLMTLYTVWSWGIGVNLKTISQLRESPEFWLSVFKPISESIVELDVELQGKKFTDMCYQIMSRVWIFKILGLEVYISSRKPNVSNSNLGKQLPEPLADRLTRMRVVERFVGMVSQYTQCRYQESALSDVWLVAQQIGFDISTCVNVLKNGVYSEKNYIFDRKLIEKKLDGRRDNNMIRLIQCVQAYNVNKCLKDIQERQAEAWCLFVRVGVWCSPKRVLGSTDASFIWSFAQHLVTRIQESMNQDIGFDEESESVVINDVAALLLSVVNHGLSIELTYETQEKIVINQVLEGLILLLSKYTTSFSLRYNDVISTILSTLFALTKVQTTLRGKKKSNDKSVDLTETDSNLLISMIEPLFQLMIKSHTHVSEAALLITSITKIISSASNNNSNNKNNNNIGKINNINNNEIISRLSKKLRDCNGFTILVRILSDALQDKGNKTTTNENNNNMKDGNDTDVEMIDSNVHNAFSGSSNEKIAESVLFLLIELSRNVYFAESLAVERLMDVLCNPNLVYLKKSEIGYLQSSERNPWHKVWCLVITLATTMITSLGKSDKLIDHAIEFISIHSHRLLSAVRLFYIEGEDFVTYPTITLASTEELEKIVYFVEQLSNYVKRWRLYAESSFETWKHSFLFLIHSLTIILLDYQTFSRQTIPISSSEKVLDTAIVGNTVNPLLPKPNLPPSSNTEPVTKNFIVHVELLLCRSLRGVLTIILKMGPKIPITDPRIVRQIFIENSKNFGESPPQPIFSIDLAPSNKGQVSMLLLVHLFSYLSNLIKKITKKQIIGIKSKDLNRVIVTAAELTLTIFVSHMLLYLTSPDLDNQDERFFYHVTNEFGSSIRQEISKILPMTSTSKQTPNSPSTFITNPDLQTLPDNFLQFVSSIDSYVVSLMEFHKR